MHPPPHSTSGHLGRPQTTRERPSLPPGQPLPGHLATSGSSAGSPGGHTAPFSPHSHSPLPIIVPHPHPSGTKCSPTLGRGKVHPGAQSALVVRGWVLGSVPRAGSRDPPRTLVLLETRPKRHAVRRLSYPKCPTGSTLFFVCRFQNWPCNSQTL